MRLANLTAESKNQIFEAKEAQSTNSDVTFYNKVCAIFENENQLNLLDDNFQDSVFWFNILKNLKLTTDQEEQIDYIYRLEENFEITPQESIKKIFHELKNSQNEPLSETQIDYYIKEVLPLYEINPDELIEQDKTSANMQPDILGDKADIEPTAVVLSSQKNESAQSVKTNKVNLSKNRKAVQKPPVIKKMVQKRKRGNSNDKDSDDLYFEPSSVILSSTKNHKKQFVQSEEINFPKKRKTVQNDAVIKKTELKRKRKRDSSFNDDFDGPDLKQKAVSLSSKKNLFKTITPLFPAKKIDKMRANFSNKKEEKEIDTPIEPSSFLNMTIVDKSTSEISQFSYNYSCPRIDKVDLYDEYRSYNEPFSQVNTPQYGYDSPENTVYSPSPINRNFSCSEDNNEDGNIHKLTENNVILTPIHEYDYNCDLTPKINFEKMNVYSPIVTPII